MKPVTEPYRRFTGLNKNTVALDAVLPTELIEADNILFDPRGGYSTVWGSTRHTPNAIDANPIKRVINCTKPDGSTVKLYTSGTTLWKDNGNNTYTALINTLSTAEIDHFEWQEYLYFNDGVKYYRTNYTTVEEVPPKTGADLTGVKKCRVHEWYPMWFRHFWGMDDSDVRVLWFSEDDDPTNILSSASSTKKVYPIANLGKLTAIKDWRDSILVGYQKGWMKWTGGGTNPVIGASWRRVKASSGPTTKRGIDIARESLAYTADDGVYILESADITAEDNARKISENIDTLYKSLVNKDKMVAKFVLGRYLLIAGCDGAVAYNNIVLVADFDIMTPNARGELQPAWSIMRNTYANDFMEVDGVIYYGHSNNGLVMKFDPNVATNDGTQISWVAEHYVTLYDRNGTLNPFAKTKIKKIHLAAKQYANSLPITVEVTCDYDNETFTIDLNESFAWGNKWGLMYGWTDFVSKEGAIGKKARRLRVRLEGQGKFTLLAWGPEYKPGKTKGEKSGVTKSS